VTPDHDLQRLLARSDALEASNEWGDEAIEVNERIIELEPQAAHVYNRLAKSYRLASDHRTARSFYERVLDIVTDGPVASIARAGLAGVSERIDAEEEAQRVAREREATVGEVTDPLEARARGKIAREQGDLELAIRFLRRAVDLWS
jgi:tetratricopeptide (TPR) repeat protein